MCYVIDTALDDNAAAAVDREAVPPPLSWLGTCFYTTLGYWLSNSSVSCVEDFLLHTA